MDVLECFLCSSKNWHNKKNKIKSLLDHSTFYRTDLIDFETDRYKNNKSYMKNFSEIFSDELSMFAQEYKLSQITFNDMWCVSYQQGDYQLAHNHGSKGFSGILYLDYDEKNHTPTYFLSPLMDPIADMHAILNLSAKEGDMIIFPSNILHYNKVNKSTIPRTVISFDILVER